MNLQNDYLCIPSQWDNQKKCYCKYCNGVFYHQQYKELKGTLQDYKKQIFHNIQLKSYPQNIQINSSSTLLIMKLCQQQLLYLIQLFQINRQFKILQKLPINSNHFQTFQKQLGYISKNMNTCLNFVYFNKQKTNFTIQKLKGPQNFNFTHFEINQDENLFIGGHQDYLQFYQKKDRWILDQSIYLKDQEIVGLNLNTQDNRLIVELRNNNDNLTLLLLEKQNNEWKILKEIDWTNSRKIQFLSNDIFVRQFISECLELFQWDEQIEDFKQIHQTQLYGKGFIKMKFIKKLNMLFVFTKNSINIYKFHNNRELRLLQVQKFKKRNEDLIQISQDGQLLIEANFYCKFKRVNILRLCQLSS